MGACEAASVWFVDAAKGGDGKSWASAFEFLKDAFDASGSGDEVWVAKGTYKPTTGSDRTIAFILPSGVEVYGGFPAGSGEPSWADRDWLENTTTLSGDIDSGGNEDCYHVVKGADKAVLDGFVISGGRADGSGVDNLGGGMYNENCEPVVRNCVFTDNSADYGGGMYNKYCSPEVRNCVLSGNTAYRGGGVFNQSASPKFERCVFVGNIGDVRGGGMFNDGATSNPEVVNCVFQGNSSLGGGGMLNASRGSHPTITNCTLTGNDASEVEGRPPHGGGMFNGAASPTVTNCIFWGNTCDEEASKEVYNGEAAANPSFRHCDIEGSGGSGNWNGSFGHDGGGNKDEPPVFEGAGNPKGLDDKWMTVDDGLQLTLDVDYLNPCVDAGDDDAAPARDIVGIRRRDISWISGTLSDIGAYEFCPASVPVEKATMVVMLWIDESSPYYSASYNSHKLILFLTDLDDYHDVVANAGVRAVRSGCRVPPTNVVGEGYTKSIADVLPYNYNYDPENPPAGITISKSGRPPTLNEIIADFDEIRDGAEPDYLVLIVDNSTSMVPDDIDPAYTQFRDWVQERHHVIISPDEWPYHTTEDEEDWVQTMADKITYFLNNL